MSDSPAERPDDPSLGRCLGEYRTSAAGYGALAAIMLASMVVATGFFSIAAAGTGEALGGRIVLLLLGLVCLLPALFGIYGLIRGRDNALRLYEKGLVLHQAGTDQRATWDEVESYAEGLFLSVVTKDGTTIQVATNGLRAVAEIISKLREEVVLRRALPRLRSLLHEGQTIALDGLDSADIATESSSDPTYVAGFTLDAKAITPDETGRSIAWGDVLEWGVSEGQTGSRNTARVDYAFVRTASGRFQTVFENSSDRHTLLALCEALSTAARGLRGSRSRPPSTSPL